MTAGPRERAAAVQRALDGLLQIRRVMNAGAAEPEAVPAEWERLQPVRAVALVLEAAGIPPSAVGDDGRRLCTGYVVRPSEPTGALPRGRQPQTVARVEWHGPSGSRAAYEQHTGLGRCAQALEKLGWLALEYRGERRLHWLEVEPLTPE
ncbi:hypothetical protein [Streptomyces griseocarneus]|uniref:hypothetical protein n=1 Tax=Streptomyces griseocarneus TaxID=51201 RepID=UPI001CCD2B35|nr:hypothetical protein [Streptomyces griseocarneus]MBZ6475130.1 hypothetical protein [Streptomyces griseocarneus]